MTEEHSKTILNESQSPLTTTTTSKNKIPPSAQACIACKRRKRKCLGNPCVNCIRKNIVCEFEERKKRPKKVKFPKKVEECGLACLPLINNIQKSMNLTYQQHNVVDFYFLFLGKYIPKPFKDLLLVSRDKLTNERTSQLYIVSSHIMKFFGNSELEKECIQNAHKFSGNIYESDSMDAAVSLAMMAAYLGDDHPKSHNYITMAYNIMTLPTIEQTKLAIRFRYACQIRTIFLNKELTQRQKFIAFEEQLLASAQNVIYDVSPSEWITVEFSRLKARLYDKEVVAYCIPEFITSVHPVSLRVQPQVYMEWKTVLDTLNTLLIAMGNEADVDIPFLGYYTLNISLYRFLVEWRGGNMQQAFVEAENTLAFCKTNSTLFGLWCYDNLLALTLLFIPYFYQECGALEQAQTTLQYYEDSVRPMGHHNKLSKVWQEIQAGTSRSAPDMIQLLEAELMAPINSSSSDNSPQLNDIQESPQSNTTPQSGYDGNELSYMF